MTYSRILQISARVSPLLLLLLYLSLFQAFAKDKEEQITLTWPPDKPSIKLTFGRFKQLYALGHQNTYMSDVTVENLTDKAFPRVVFTVYLADKNKVRVGDGQLQVSDIGPGQQVKVAFQVNSVGVPASLSLAAKRDMLSSVKTVPVKIISVPPGAKLKVDGQETGVTPIMVKFTEGSHTLEFSKEGYATGTTPLEVTPDELPGGSITFELGGLSADTVEMRDGTVLLGDVISASLTQVVVRVNGQEQMIDRNRIKKIILVERQVIQQLPVTQPVAQPAPSPK
jgi:hypothetical protein